MSTSSSPLFDLTSEHGVHAYISSTPFATEDPSEITSLSGGTANFTYRLHLRNPYEGRSTVILKHAEPYAKQSSTLAFSVERQVYEVEALTRIHAYLPSDSFVTVPKVHLFDVEQHVIIMDDCGECNTTLKDYVLQGHLTSTETTKELARSLSQFIASIHRWGNNAAICEFFDGNQQAKTLSSWATYGRLVETLTSGQQQLPAFHDNPISISEENLGIIRKLADTTQQAMLSANQYFVMGDFWTGNVILSLDASNQIQRVYVVDWELAKPGILGVELGQFCAELDLLQKFHPESTSVISTFLTTFLTTYREHGIPDAELARRTLVHWATHLVVWTPVVPWGSNETTREVVLGAIQLLLEGANKEKGLQESIVCHLL